MTRVSVDKVKQRAFCTAQLTDNQKVVEDEFWALPVVGDYLFDSCGKKLIIREVQRGRA